MNIIFQMNFSLLYKIVASLAENVKKMDLVGANNKENALSKCIIAIKKPQISLLDNYLAESIHIEQIESPYPNETILVNEDDEPIDPSYAMDYIVDIMNLLYTLEKKYPIHSSYLANSPSATAAMATIANGSAVRTWKLSVKHRIIVVGWLIQLFYARFHLSQDALHR